ncbi:unnamed protein product [Polarella glacialis]|uniref:RING-type domain-containing protein n=1 Tax=Polarella glacialis TaxID=89957 RepID=A0A813FX46_POLGL|nr:unnamed protein product [Polarella glacialis]
MEESSELPYRGDIGAAMRAQDRDAVRQILSAQGRQDGQAVSSTAQPTSRGGNDWGLSIEQFKCAICRELLHKPCIASCGHPFCFWCLHQAMSPVAPSACPLCIQRATANGK